MKEAVSVFPFLAITRLFTIQTLLHLISRLSHHRFPAADRQSFYGSFTRDLCDKYLTVFADFKYTRSYFQCGPGANSLYARSVSHCVRNWV